MPLKSHTFSFDSLSDVPEVYKDVAKESDGKYTVQVVHADDVKEFRDNNVGLMKERDTMLATLGQYEQATGITLADLTEGKATLEDFSEVLSSLKETKQRVDDGKLVEETSLEEAAAARVAKVRQELQGQIDALTKDRDAHRDARTAAERAKEEFQIENILRAAAGDPEVAMIENAVSMILPQALRVFKLDEGRIVAKEADGTTMYGQDGMNPMTPKEWLLKQRDVHSYLFQGSRGGGAAGSSDGTPGKMSFEQMKKQGLRPEQIMEMARKQAR